MLKERLLSTQPKIMLSKDKLLIDILRKLVKDKNDDQINNMINKLEEASYRINM